MITRAGSVTYSHSEPPQFAGSRRSESGGQLDALAHVRRGEHRLHSRARKVRLHVLAVRAEARAEVAGEHRSRSLRSS